MPVEGPISEIIIDTYPKGDGIDWLTILSAFGNILGGVGAAVAAIYSVVAARASEKTAELASKDFEAGHMPHVVFDAYQWDAPATGKYRISFLMKNAGTLPAKIRPKSIKINSVEQGVPSGKMSLAIGQSSSMEIVVPKDTIVGKFVVEMIIEYDTFTQENFRYRSLYEVEFDGIDTRRGAVLNQDSHLSNL